MPYHVRALDRCRCGKPATHEVRNHRNASIMRGCKSCANKKLDQLKRAYGD